MALDIYGRFRLDVGQAVQEKAASATVAMARLKEIRDYIRETVAAMCRRLRTGNQVLNAGRVARTASQVLREAFQVFEDYVR